MKTAFSPLTVALGLVAATASTTATANRGPFYYVCYAAAGVSDAYISGVFSVSYENRYKIEPQMEAFKAAVLETFDVHPSLADPAQPPRCNSQRTREDAEKLRETFVKSQSGRNRAVYDTGWTPQEGIRNREPAYVPE